MVRKLLGVMARECPELHQSLLAGLRDHQWLEGLRAQKSFPSFETHLLCLQWSPGFAPGNRASWERRRREVNRLLSGCISAFLNTEWNCKS